MNASTTMRAAAACALLASTCFGGAAQAQTTGGAIGGYVGPPAEKLFVTPGGVDIRTGKYAYAETDLSIGGQGDDGLSLIRTMGGLLGSFGNFSHNYDIVLFTKRVDIAKSNYEPDTGQDYRVTVHFPDGRTETFDSKFSDTGFEQKSQNPTAILTYTGDRSSPDVVYTFTATDGTIMRFRPGPGAGVSEIIRPNGTRLLLDYGGATGWARPRSVVSTRGYALLFEHGGEGLVAKACALNLSRVTKPVDNVCPGNAEATSSYTYTYVQRDANFGRTRLATSTNPEGATSSYSYAYDQNALTMAFTKPGATTPWLTNLVSERSVDGQNAEVVGSQSFADGGGYAYEYIEAAMETGGAVDMPVGTAYIGASGERTVIRFDFPRRPLSYDPPADPFRETEDTIDPNGGTKAVYQITPGPVEIVDPLGRRTTMDYCDAYLKENLPPSDTEHRCVVTQLQSYTDPDGIRTELSYGGRHVVGVRRKAKPGSGLDDIVLNATYQCSNRKTCVTPNMVTDANGNVSNATYSLDHGGVLTETGPAVGGIRPQKRYAYAQRYAWLKTASGGHAPAASPVWLLMRESFCRTSAATGDPGAPCATANDEVVTEYDYGPDAGPNNLQLRGIVVDAGPGRLNLRTCYAYDAAGNKTGETSPRAGLAACPSS